MQQGVRRPAGKSYLLHLPPGCPGAGHDSWTATYADPELYEWFLSPCR